MLNRTSNQRESQYQNLNDFTNKVHRDIMDVTSALGWTLESIETDNDNRLVCPYDSSHRIGKDLLDRHLESCQSKEEGYDEFDIPLSEPILHLHSPFSIKLDASLQNSIIQEAKKRDSTMKVGSGERLIPRTSDRIFADFTRDERKVLYEHVVSNTVKTVIGHDITDAREPKCQDKEDKKLSFLELLVQERNLKRRRAKHRGVHTNKKSHTEILREVINQQMELYIDHVSETRPTGRCSKTMDIVETPTNSNRHLDDTMHNSSLPLNESPTRHRNLYIENSQGYRGTSNSRNDRYERAETIYAPCSEHREKREKCSRTTTTESWKQQKQRKRRRSYSRERDYDKKSKHCHTQQSSRKGSIKSRETEKPFVSACQR